MDRAVNKAVLAVTVTRGLVLGEAVDVVDAHVSCPRCYAEEVEEAVAWSKIGHNR